ncbi:MAG: cyclic nucleotide-binding domain-containing protein [Gemmatimonadetes bacterium]|nr:cyclic nucleotide-binding domain-containing protein [Gemmatimonadota bacterium]
MTETTSGWSTELVVGLLQKVALFEDLTSEDLRRIATVAAEATPAAGAVLFREGDPADAFYVVLEGAVSIATSRADGAEEVLAVRREGEAFGEMALFGEGPRSATARTTDPSRLVRVPGEDFRRLLGGESLALHLLRAMARDLRIAGARFASTEDVGDPGARVREDAARVSRLIQARLLPRTAPRLEGFDVAAGTTTEKDGSGGSAWDWVEMTDGRTVALTMDVRQDGFPRAYQVGLVRAVVRAAAASETTLPGLLARVNDVLAETAVDGLDQYVDVGVLAAGDARVEWASAGRVPGGIIRREGAFEEFGAHGPPLGMLAGFKYASQEFSMSSGDTAFVLSHATPGLFLGAADLVAQLHGKPAGEVVGTLHKAIRKAEGEQHAETSVLYLRKH